MVFEDTGRSLRHTRSHLKPRGPDFPHISERYLQQNPVLSGNNAVSSENSVILEAEGENPVEQAQNSVLSGPPLNAERDTAVSLISDASEERAMTFPDNPVSQTRYIPLRLCNKPPQPKPPFDARPIDLMTPATDVTPVTRLETKEQIKGDHDSVPDTGSFAKSSAAETSRTLESSPGSSSTMETGETTDTASSETSGSTSSSEGSTESDSAPSTPLSPRWTSTPCTEKAITAKVSSRPPSPSPADSSLEMRQFY